MSELPEDVMEYLGAIAEQSEVLEQLGVRSVASELLAKYAPQPKTIPTDRSVTPADEALAQLVTRIASHPDATIREAFCGIEEAHRDTLAKVAALTESDKQ